MTELKPCPYCCKRNDLGTAKWARGFVIRCGYCGAIGPNRRTEPEAIAAWNTRPTKPVED